MNQHDQSPLEGDAAASSRRSFLKLAGFSFATAAVSGCSRGRIEKAIPYLVPAEEITPGRAYFVATTCGACSAGCGVLAKCRDGRPIKLEGNPAQPVNRGGLCAVGQAAVLSLYDAQRLDGPMRGGAPATWEAVDQDVRARLAAIKASGGRIVLLTGTLHGPSTRAAIDRFAQHFGNVRHVMYDALSVAAIALAHQRTHGVRVLPALHFDRARVIVSFAADFLATWISPVEFTADYALGRNPDASPPICSRHIQLESCFSLSGSRADQRIPLAPWQVVPVLERLCAAIAQRSGRACTAARAGVAAAGDPVDIEALADELWQARGHGLVVCGQNDVSAQVLVNRLNALLDNYGVTLDLTRASQQRLGNDAELHELQRAVSAGEVDLMIVQGQNPAYDLPDASWLDKVPTLIVCASTLDETAARAHLVCPEPHFLEAWDDGEPHQGVYTLTQPTLPSLRRARTLRESLARWIGDPQSDLELVKAAWRDVVHARVAAAEPFDAFFHRVQSDAFVVAPVQDAVLPALREDDAAPLAMAPPAAGEHGLVLYASSAMQDGRHAHNPWLQELPDPITKVVWDNYACVSPALASALCLATGDHVRITSPELKGALELPALVQPGQHDQVIAVALGYGRRGTDRFARIGPQWLQAEPTVAAGALVGVNAAPWIRAGELALGYHGRAVRVARTGRRSQLACTQDHHRLEVPEHLRPHGGEVRDAVRTTTLATWLSSPERALLREPERDGQLWPADHRRRGPHWGMVVDLNACTGCSACVIACQAENNVPVVGKDEVARHREMHWLRIDRYYQGDGASTTAVHQPMMCQHCGNAPCETVCPVLATVHSKDGLNQQVYNRCVGTRYCANNCPYKVRRFNWFDYPHTDQLQNMVLNPDVTVRSRGVMEKCSLCVQRIAEAKAEARRQGVPIKDGDIEPACQQSCPASAITFGDLDDPGSAAARKAASLRAYAVLGELNVAPSVRYLAQVANRDHKGSAAHAG
ncbi:MAG: 4Fe-4S dicluster domain-containing protein [Planctomycetota bacterium]